MSAFVASEDCLSTAAGVRRRDATPPTSRAAKSRRAARRRADEPRGEEPTSRAAKEREAVQ
jgi:hypothetical protein